MATTTSDILTTVLAVWGAILSSVLAIFKIVEFRRDRADVVVSYKIGWRVANSPIYDASKNYLVVTIMNRGRRPVTITGVGAIAEHADEKDFILTDSVVYGNRELLEGKATQYLVEQDGWDISRYKWFIAFDMTGRKYRCRIRKQDRRHPVATT